MQEEHVTTAHAPQAPDGAPARGGRNFRRWRRSRPFWGGLFLILSAIELFLSSNLNLGNLQVHFGPSGFLSYVIPAMLLLCGVLTWFSPGQRIFYGILGTLTAVYSLIGLNFGGFVAGLLLGCIGGALTVAWSQQQPEPAAPAAPPAVDETYVGQSSTAVYGTPAAEQPQQDEPGVDPGAEPRHGLLTDTLPTSLRSPLHDDEGYGGRHTTGYGGAGYAEDERPPDSGPLPRRRMRQIGGMFSVLVLVAAAFAAASQPLPALAAPSPSPSVCPSSTSPKASPTRTTTSAPAAPGAGAAARTDASASASPTASASAEEQKESDGGGIIDGIVDFFTGIFGGGDEKKAAEPEPSASASASALPSAGPSGSPNAPAGSATPTPSKTSAKPCVSASASVPPKRAALAAGQPAVALQPSLLLANVQTMTGLSYDGIVDLPTKTSNGPGTIRVLKFSMRTSVSRPFELRTPGGPKNLLTKSSELTVAGNVAFYTNRFAGKVLGLIPQTYTPESPPLLIVPDVLFTDVEIQLVFVQADELRAPSLDLRFAA
jgi:hypothetical protein